MSITMQCLNADGSYVTGSQLILFSSGIAKINKGSVTVQATPSGGIIVPIGREPHAITMNFTLRSSADYTIFNSHYYYGQIVHITASSYAAFDVGGNPSTTGATGSNCAVYVVTEPKDDQKEGYESSKWDCSATFVRYPNWKKV